VYDHADTRFVVHKTVKLVPPVNVFWRGAFNKKRGQAFGLSLFLHLGLSLISSLLPA
jgi:hypothetical protein